MSDTLHCIDGPQGWYINLYPDEDCTGFIVQVIHEETGPDYLEDCQSAADVESAVSVGMEMIERILKRNPPPIGGKAPIGAL